MTRLITERDTKYISTNLTLVLSYLNLNPLELVSRYRDPQLKVRENYSHMCLN